MEVPPDSQNSTGSIIMFSDLPNEVLLMILEHVAKMDLSFCWSVRRVNRLISKLVPQVLYKKDMSISGAILPPALTWKNIISLQVSMAEDLLSIIGHEMQRIYIPGIQIFSAVFLTCPNLQSLLCRGEELSAASKMNRPKFEHDLMRAGAREYLNPAINPTMKMNSLTLISICGADMNYAELNWVLKHCLVLEDLFLRNMTFFGSFDDLDISIPRLRSLWLRGLEMSVAGLSKLINAFPDIVMLSIAFEDKKIEELNMSTKEHLKALQLLKTTPITVSTIDLVSRLVDSAPSLAAICGAQELLLKLSVKSSVEKIDNGDEFKEYLKTNGIKYLNS